MSTPKHLMGSWKHYSAVPRTIWQNGCPFGCQFQVTGGGCPKLCWEGFWGCIWPPQERALPSINDVCQGEGAGGSSEWPHIALERALSASHLWKPVKDGLGWHGQSMRASPFTELLNAMLPNFQKSILFWDDMRKSCSYQHGLGTFLNWTTPVYSKS